MARECYPEHHSRDGICMGGAAQDITHCKAKTVLLRPAASLNICRSVSVERPP